MTQMTIDTLVRRFEDVMNARDADAVAALFTPDFVDHAPWPGQSGDVAGFRAGLADMVAAFPDLRVDVHRVVANGDMLAWHFAISGSHLGPFMGAEPTGRSFRVEAMDMLRLEDGRIAEHWGLMDSASMAEQLSLA
jgi:steroid delta-isomerase-like uncharacterized protein